MSNEKHRILAFAVRARWLGFAVFEGSARLIDWGMIFYQRKGATALKSTRHRTASIISRLIPTHIVLFHEPFGRSDLARVRSITREIRRTANAFGIPTTRYFRDKIRSSFSRRNTRTKHEIATAIASLFPELAWRLPPERKLWKKEDCRMALFDAVAAALAFYDAQFTHTPPVLPSGRPLGDVQTDDPPVTPEGPTRGT